MTNREIPKAVKDAIYDSAKGHWLRLDPHTHTCELSYKVVQEEIDELLPGVQAQFHVGPDGDDFRALFEFFGNSNKFRKQKGMLADSLRQHLHPLPADGTIRLSKGATVARLDKAERERILKGEVGIGSIISFFTILNEALEQWARTDFHQCIIEIERSLESPASP